MTATFDLWLSNLFRLYHREAVRFATRLVGGPDNGEEVVQDAWLKICARNSTTAIEHPKSYLFTATRNSAIDFTMRRRKEWTSRVDIDCLNEADLIDTSAQLYEQRRELARLAVLLNELPNSCRQAFILNKFDGYSHVEIARKMEISVSMVEKHIMRALLHCRSLGQD